MQIGATSLDLVGPAVGRRRQPGKGHRTVGPRLPSAPELAKGDAVAIQEFFAGDQSNSVANLDHHTRQHQSVAGSSDFCVTDPGVDDILVVRGGCIGLGQKGCGGQGAQPVSLGRISTRPGFDQRSFCGHQRGERRRGRGPGYIIDRPVGAPGQHMSEQRMGFHGRIPHKSHCGNRAGIEPELRLALGPQGRINSPALLSRRHGQQFQKCAAADGDLPIIGIGRRQQAGQVGPQNQSVSADQLHQPRLFVVRIGGQDRMCQGPAPDIAFTLTRITPGLRHIRPFRAATKQRQNRHRRRHSKHVAPCRHG